MSVKKIEWLQLLRGGVTVFVVFGHIIWYGEMPKWYSIAHDVVYLFHMPAFFFMSGFLFGLRERFTTTTVVIKKKLMALGLPYLLFSVVYFLMKLMMQRIVRVQKQASAYDLLRIFFFPDVSSTVYWFLFVLILYFLLFSLCRNNHIISCVLACVSVICFLIWKSNAVHIFNNCFERFVGYAFCFLASMMIGEKYECICKNTKRIFFILLPFSIFFLTFSIPFCANLRSVWTYENKNLLIAFCSLLLLITGILFMIDFAMLVAKTRILKKPLLLIGDYSWSIYLIHIYFLNLTRNVLAKTIIFQNPFFYCSINLLAGVIFPILCARVIAHIPIIDFLFYPAKYIRKR